MMIRNVSVVLLPLLVLTAFPDRSRASFVFPDFSSTTGLQLNGSAAAAGTVLRLTNTGTFEAGSAWYTAGQRVQGGFATTFQFQITRGLQGGGDGFAFVIQNSSTTALGLSGGYLGYAGVSSNPGIPNSIAIEFDTIQNGNFHDPNSNHISVHTRGTLPNDADEAFSLGATTSIPDINDGNIHQIMIEYAPGTLQIFMDDNLTPRLTVAVNLGTLLNLDDGRAFVGFTAGTGTATEDHDILNWSFTESPAKAVPEPSTFVLLCTGFLGVFGYCRRRERIQG
jgi:hypothetical protein